MNTTQTLEIIDRNRSRPGASARGLVHESVKMSSETPASTKTLLVLGGGDIGRATAIAFAAQGWNVQLAGRDLPSLQLEADDIAARTSAATSVYQFDALDTASFARFVDGLPLLPDVVVSVVGVLGDQLRAESDLEHATMIMRSNYEGPSLILGLLANRFVARGSGTIVGVSSVVGDRGRASTNIYSSAKAGFTAFLSGLRNRLAKHGVHVVTVKPGYVRTKMTAGFNLPPWLTTDPDRVGNAIVKAVARRADVVYAAPVWRLVTAITRAIPEAVFKKLKI